MLLIKGVIINVNILSLYFVDKDTISITVDNIILELSEYLISINEGMWSYALPRDII